jgi:thiamine-phosphate diphosphorylase
MSQPFQFPDPVYAIADDGGVNHHTSIELADAVLAAGVRLLQLRVKKQSTRSFVELAREIKARADRAGASLIVNDRADIARLIDAAGVHVGREDLSPSDARAIVGERRVVGVSTHSVTQARAAQRSGGINYIAFGPVYSTVSKEGADTARGVQELHEVRQVCALPLVAIGGINIHNLSSVMATGVDAVAVIAAIAQDNNPTAAARALVTQAYSLRRETR